MKANITAPSISELSKLQAQIPSLKIIEVTRQREGLNILVRDDHSRFPVFLKKAREIIISEKLNLSHPHYSTLKRKGPEDTTRPDLQKISKTKTNTKFI